MKLKKEILRFNLKVEIVEKHILSMEKMEFIASQLTAVRIKILKMLKKEKHPEEIAEELEITRQAVDKHLKILYDLGMVKRKIKYGKRIQVYYEISEAGEEFLMNFEEMVNNYILSMRKSEREEIMKLDNMLVNGEINEREYWKRRKAIEGRLGWLKKSL